MNYKKKSLILSICFILTIQIFLLINNRQKTSFRFFIWDVKEVTTGRLICITFISGLLVSSLLNKTLQNDLRIYPNKEEDTETSDENNSSNNQESDESFEIPPERDLRDVQPTISVNYRIIKDNGENESKDRYSRSQNTQYKDDWNNNDSEW